MVFKSSNCWMMAREGGEAYEKLRNDDVAERKKKTRRKKSDKPR